MSYSIYDDFNLSLHKETYINYLEVLIDKDGTVMYAVPSHQARLEILAAKKNHCSVQDIRDNCPTQWHFDYLTYLIQLTGAVCVWTQFEQHSSEVTIQQCSALRRLKVHGLYKGSLIKNPTNISEKETTKSWISSTKTS